MRGTGRVAPPGSIRAWLRATGPRVGSILPALLLPQVLFVTIPLKLYLPNRGDLESDLLPYVAALAASGGLAVLVALLLAPARYRGRLATGMFFAGAYFLLADALAPTTLPVLDGQHELGAMAEPLSYTGIELALLVLAGAAAWWTPPKSLSLFGSLLVLGFLVSDLVQLELARIQDAATPAPAAGAEPRASSSPAMRPNVYHFVFDGFSADGFEKLVDEAGAREELAGFVWFRHNRTNHTATTFSFPSFLSGRLIQTEDFHDWRRGVLSGRSGLFSDALEHGYTVSSYGDCRDLPGRCTSAREVELPRQRSARILHFFDLWALRVVPNFLQAESYAAGAGLFSRAREKLAPGEQPTHDYLRRQRVLALVGRVIRDEPSRPAAGQYVFAHFMIPHRPFVFDPECGYRGEDPPYVEGVEVPPGHYLAQAGCALRQILGLVDELRRLDRFDKSAILVHADHGNFTRCIDPAPWDMSDETSRRIEAVSMNGRTGRKIDCWSRTLLLVKRPGAAAGAELEVSDRRTQLLDIRATLAAMAGMGPVATGGVDVFAEPFPQGRPLSLVAGSYQPLRRRAGRSGRPNRFVHVCQQLRRGELNHFVHAPAAGGWSIEPNIRVECD